ncbi:MAG: hypothetical protein ACRBCS_08930 [Cellvibrionaceae bacterium]
MSIKKRNVSVRLSESDIKKMKGIADRFGVKESELFRYAVKSVLTKLMPFNDKNLRGADLVPAWLESGQDILTYFPMDAEQIENIFNFDINEKEKKIEQGDIDLIVLSNLNEKFVVKRLSEICDMNIGHSDVQRVLHKYIYDKYVINDNTDNNLEENWNQFLNKSLSKKSGHIEQD